MAVYLAELNLRDVTLEQFEAVQQRAIETSLRFTAEGKINPLVAHDLGAQRVARVVFVRGSKREARPGSKRDGQYSIYANCRSARPDTIVRTQ